MRILLAEDERTLHRILKKRLTEEGWSVDGCFDGEETLDYLRAAPYDAVILDVMMPKRDGFSVLAEARREGIDAPVLFLTARDGIEDRVRGLDLGASDYLVKPFAMADLLARLEQNLISNACRYGKPGGTVSVELSKEDSWDSGEAPPLAALRVRDDGQGIREEDLERIFERFWRCDESRSTEGTGLGLAMVKKIAELHGAEIRVESKPGEGSVFTVLFPLPLSDAK